MDLKFDFTVGFSKPPVTTHLYKFQDLDLDVLRRIKSSVHETIEKLKDDKEVSTEADILRKLHYKFRNQWRREKVLKSIKQVHNVWMKFKSINLIGLLNELKDLLPNRIFGRETTYLPSFLLVCYKLSVLLRACALLKVASDLCVVGCERAHQQINNYLFAQYMTICYGALSKFCFLCKTMLDILSDCYKNVRDLSGVLQVPQNLIKGFNMLPREVKPWLESDNFFSFHISSLFSSEQGAENGVTHSSSNSSSSSNIAEEILGGAIMQPVEKMKSVSTSSTTTSDLQLSSTISSEQGANDFQSLEPTTTTLLTNAGTSQENNQSFQILTTGDDDVDDDDEDGTDDNNDMFVEQQKETTDIKIRKLNGDENRLKKKAKPENIEEPSDQEEHLSKDFVPSISQEEMEKISGSADDCSTIGQLLSLIRELKESKKGTKLKGFKICLNKLKSMRDEVKELVDSVNNDNISTLKKTKKLLLKKSKTSVKKLLAKNLSLRDG